MVTTPDEEVTAMPMPRSYLVRIYRQGFDLLGGTVQDITTAGSRPFSSLDELGVMLLAPIDPDFDPDDVTPLDTSPDSGD